MQYTLLITGSPYQSKACHTALRFIRAALNKYPNSIKGVFFYEDAVLIGNQTAQPPRDEINLTKAWQEIAEQHSVPLYLCIAAAVRRGIINENVPSSKGYQGGFMVDLMVKDLGLSQQAALASNSSTPMGSLARSLYVNHARQGNGSRDFSSIFEQFAKKK